MKDNLISKLKKDSIFIMYNEISNFQNETLTAIYFSDKTKKRTTFPSSKSLEELTAYYKDFGIEKPEQYAKLDIMKSMVLGTLVKKHPELKTMDIQTKIEVLKTTKGLLKQKDVSKLKEIVKKVLNKRHH